MRLIELPVFLSKTETEPTKIFINPDNVNFVAKADIPTPVVDAKKKPLTREGTCLGMCGGGLLVDALWMEVAILLQGSVKEVKKDESKPSKGNKK